MSLQYAKIIEVIETDVCRGEGTDLDPCRRVKQYWSKDGELLAEKDPVTVPTLNEYWTHKAKKVDFLGSPIK